MEETFDLSEFSGFLPLFPLPNLVLFPGIILPLHIFEERYREMLRFAQSSERFIGMVLLRPGWEPEYHDTPSIYSVACMGRIMVEERLDDGGSNILLMGLCRVSINQEVIQKPFRVGQVELLEESDAESSQENAYWHDRLLQLCRRFSPILADHMEAIQFKEGFDIPLGSLADSIAAATEIDGHEKQVVLEELDVIRRAIKLQGILTAHLREEGMNEPHLPPTTPSMN